MTGTIRLCPKCGSRDISVDSGWLVGLGVPAKYVCDDCNFSSVMFPEVLKKDVKKAQAGRKYEKSREHNYVDTGYGDFLVFGSLIWWKAVGFVNVLMSIMVMYPYFSGSADMDALYFGMAFLVVAALTLIVAYFMPKNLSVNQKRVVGALIILELVVFSGYLVSGHGMGPIRFPGI